MYAGTFVGTQKQSLDPDWIWECLCTRDLLHLHLNLKGKESSPNPHLFFSHERVRNTPMSFTSTPAVEKQEKTHLSPVICALGECLPCYWCFHLLMLQNFVCVAVFFPFLFLPVFSWCYPSTLFSSLLFLSSPRRPALRSEFILGPHQSHRRAGAASSASVSPSLPPPPPPSITSSR